MIMELRPAHAAALAALTPVRERHGLVLAGGYALAAHGLTGQRPGTLTLATATGARLETVTADAVDALATAGIGVQVVRGGPRAARLTMATEDGESPVELLKEAIGQPVQTELGPVLARHDAVGLKVRALHDRGLAGDLTVAYAAGRHYSRQELAQLGARHDEDFSAEELYQRIVGVEHLADGEFAACGLDQDEVVTVRAWAASWAVELGEDIAEAEPWWSRSGAE